KLARTKAEDGKVAVRGSRGNAKKAIEKLVKDKEIGEDEGTRAEKELEAITKKHSDQIDEALAAKETELATVGHRASGRRPRPCELEPAPHGTSGRLGPARGGRRRARTSDDQILRPDREGHADRPGSRGACRAAARQETRAGAEPARRHRRGRRPGGGGAHDGVRGAAG